jgi:DNA gyrase/topoisomerase IV subunit A
LFGVFGLTLFCFWGRSPALSQQGVLVRIGAATIPESSRTAKGARLMRLDEGDAVASVELVPITDVE